MKNNPAIGYACFIRTVSSANMIPTDKKNIAVFSMLLSSTTLNISLFNSPKSFFTCLNGLLTVFMDFGMRLNHSPSH